MSTSWTSLNAYGHLDDRADLIGRMKRWPLGRAIHKAVFTDSVTGQLCSRGRLFMPQTHVAFTYLSMV